MGAHAQPSSLGAPGLVKARAMKIRCCLSRAWAGSMAGPDLAGGEECWPGLWDGDAGRADEGGSRAFGRRIRQTSHPGWDGDKMSGAKSHPQWDLCRMVLSSCRMIGAESPEKWDSCRISGATSPRGWDAAIFIPESRPRVRRCGRSRAPEAWAGGHDNPVMKSFP